MKKEITFRKFDALCERFANAPFKCGAWWPSVDDIKTHIEPKPEQNLEFLIWILETAAPPINDDQRAAKKYITALVNKTIVFTGD